jgi:hypothetical protein
MQIMNQGLFIIIKWIENEHCNIKKKNILTNGSFTYVLVPQVNVFDINICNHV